jgi:hypothetical protein
VIVRTSLPVFLLYSVACAAPPAPIGLVTASGHFTLEGSRIWSHATLFEGARIETREASSQLTLRSGVKVQLGADSAARVWPDRLILERGRGQVTSAGRFEAQAGGMRISGERFQVGLGERVEVAALAGEARVRNARGAVVAAVPAGRSMSFALYQGVTVAGCLLYKDGGFILAVPDAEVVQLTGPDLARNVGNQVEVSGTASPNAPNISPATRVINVTSVAPRSQGGCLTVAAALNASPNMPAAPAAAAKPGAPPAKPAGAPPADTGGGMSTGAKVGIVAAIAGGGAGAAIAVMGRKDSTSP